MVVADLGVSAAAYERVSLHDPDGQWELHNGQLREKPRISIERGNVMSQLPRQLQNQLDREVYRVRTNTARLRVNERHYYIPDVDVIPIATVRALQDRPGRLDLYVDPIPLVVEIWSPSTGNYDIGDKLAGYKQRGDVEIWRIHPYEKTLIMWRYQSDGTYSETTVRDGFLEPVALPGVKIDVEMLFAD